MPVTVDISDHNITDTAVKDVLRLHAQRNLTTQVLHRGHELSYFREEQVGAEFSNEVSGAGASGRQGSGRQEQYDEARAQLLRAQTRAQVSRRWRVGGASRDRNTR